jgi:hypothetical protein
MTNSSGQPPHTVDPVDDDLANVTARAGGLYFSLARVTDAHRLYIGLDLNMSCAFDLDAEQLAALHTVLGRALSPAGAPT